MSKYIKIIKFYLLFNLIALTYSENVADEYVSNRNSDRDLDYLDTSKGQNSVSNMNPEKLDYPEKRLESLRQDLQAAARNNPYYKLPSFDYRIRKMAEEHELLFRSLGVYVVHDGNEDENGDFDMSDSDHFDDSTTSENKGNNIYDMFDKSELLDAMTPEEKLHYIPKLKDAISHEIAMQKDRLEKIRDKLYR